MKTVNRLLVAQDATIKQAMKVIDQGALKTAIVIDHNNKLIGMVTDGDIRRGILNGIDIQEQVSKIMNKNPVYEYLGASKEKIVELIASKKITGLPILNKDNEVEDFVLLSDLNKMVYLNKNKEIKKHLERILVIGGGGYIGSILVRKLLSKNYKVNVLDNFTYGRDSLKNIEHNSNIHIFDGDTRHIEDITLAIKDVDAVVHLAELVGDPACALKPHITQEINYLATRTIALICKHFQINRLVYASSCSVYGASKNQELLDEKSALNPVSLYAKMKIASENALNELSDDNFMPTILRLSTVFGVSYRLRFDLVVNLLTAKAIKDGKITIFGGDQWRPNVHVADVADTIISVLESPIEVVGNQTFNVGAEENNMTISQIGELIKKNIPSAEIVNDQNNADKRDYKVNFNKIKKVLNVKIQKSIEFGIKEIKGLLEKDKSIDYTDKRYSNIKFLEDKSQ